MIKYLTKFETVAAYEAEKDNLVLPNVSLITETNMMKYMPYVDPYNGHEYVDLGLPSGTKWATMNAGATAVTDYGNEYQYGAGSEVYTGTSNYYKGLEVPLAASADTATQVMGGQWHMPTLDQLNELLFYTNKTFVNNFNDSGVNGAKFTNKTDSTKYIFIPCGNGHDVRIWSSTSGGANTKAYNLYYNSNGQSGVGNGNRWVGYNVRGVVDNTTN